MNQATFYDEIAEYYDLIYPDWEGSMKKHGSVISEMLGDVGTGSDVRILDVCAGIGTQALPLASLGYDVTARDLSLGAINRLTREALERGLRIDAKQADVRSVGESVTGRFNAVLSFDNSIPHLLSDAEIKAAFSHLAGLLSPGGQLLISVRDYDDVDRSPTSTHPYGERFRDGRRFRLGQKWTWMDESHYRTTMIVEEHTNDAWSEVVRTEADYYAVSIGRLLALMTGAGLNARLVEDAPFFQPILRGSAV